MPPECLVDITGDDDCGIAEQQHLQTRAPCVAAHVQQILVTAAAAAAAAGQSTAFSKVIGTIRPPSSCDQTVILTAGEQVLVCTQALTLKSI